MKKIIKRQQNQIPVPARRRPADQTRLHPPSTEPRERHSELNHQSAVFSFSFIKYHWARRDYQLCNQPPSQFCRTQSFHRSSVCQAQLCVWCGRHAWSLQVKCVTQWKRHILVSASLQPMCSWTSWCILFATCGKTTSECINRFIFDFLTTDFSSMSNCQWTICEKFLLFNLYDR